MNPLRLLFLALMIISCKQCHYRYSIDANLRENSDLFVTGTCPQCGTKCNQRLLCSKRFSRSSLQNDYRRIKDYVRVCQESRDHCDSQPFNREEDDDSQHSESVSYHDSNNSDETFDNFSNHNNESNEEVQSGIADSNISKVQGNL